MEREKIVFYYPVTEQVNHEKMLAAKRRWYQEAVLAVNMLDGQDVETFGRKDEISIQVCGVGKREHVSDMKPAHCPDFDVFGCVVPPFFYKRRHWKPEMLSEAMENVLYRIAGMADAWLHPQITEMLTKQYCSRWEPRRASLQMLVKYLLEQYADRAVSRSGEVVVLLGKPEETEWQMEMTGALLRPYLPRINRLLIFFEETEEADIWMELGAFLDEYYYEYGLVPQLEPYVRTNGGRWGGDVQQREREMQRGAGVCRQSDMLGGDVQRRERDIQAGVAAVQDIEKPQGVLKCGKPRCGGLILDYCGDFRYPKIMPDSIAVYLDVMSMAEKERMLRRKTPRIPYISPLKYLDTMVKSSYDRKI